jgi:hypothetical protein
VAIRRQLWHPDDVRQKIQVSQLINRLTKHALSDDGPVMDASQVQAARILLGKAIPDLSATQMTGPGGGPIQVAAPTDDRLKAALALLLAKEPDSGT